jgi:response regulator of citrate/malate metabolism
MSDYLTKPLELNRLREALERWSPRPAAPVNQDR